MKNDYKVLIIKFDVIDMCIDLRITHIIKKFHQINLINIFNTI